jgi:uncharacterized protein (TIGR02996 family)
MFHRPTTVASWRGWYPRRAPPPTPPPPPPTIADVSLSDPAEHTLLAELRGDPANESTRLVYADLLEARGELARAQFVRGDRDADPLELIETSDFAWRTILSRDRIRCWGNESCPRTWDALAPCIDDDRRRDCASCRKPVRYCATIAEERACGERGECGVIDVAGALRE